MLETIKTYWNKAVKKYPWLDLVWRRLPAAASACTAVAIGIAYWRFYLEYYTDKDEWGKVVWYKELIESNIWLNWWLLFYGMLIVFVLIAIALSRKQTIEGLIKLAFVYVTCVICLYSVPALYPVITVIPDVTYHTLFTILFGIWIAVELINVIIQFLPHKHITTKNNEIITGVQDVQWNGYLDAIVTYLTTKEQGDECFAIGIASPWGSGKTTFMHQMQKRLDETDKYLIKEFKPWMLSSASQVNSAFFKLLESIIREASVLTYEELLNTIKTYTKLISSIPDIPKPTIALLDHIRQQEKHAISDLHAKINNELCDIGKHIIILIDDIDRLDNSEMFEILRLIRISANFKSLTFIVTYDKEYLTQNISKYLACEGDEYLKKIINLEIQLPSYEDNVLGLVLYKKIESSFPGHPKLKELRYAIRKYTTDHGDLINDYLLTFRDAERFANYFTLLLRHVNEEKDPVDFNWEDLFWIEMLHYYDTKTYNLLKTNHLNLLQQADEKHGWLVAKSHTNTKQHPIVVSIFSSAHRTTGLNSIVWESNIKSYFAYRHLDDRLMLNDFYLFLQRIPTKGQIAQKVRKWTKGAVMERSFIRNLGAYDHFRIDKDDVNVAYIDTLLEATMYYKYTADNFKYICKLFKNLHSNYEPYPLNIYVKKEIIESELRQYISRHPGKLIWNVLLTTFPICVDEAVDYDEYPFFEIDSIRKPSLETLKELAELNFQGYIKLEGIKKIKLSCIFQKEYPLNAFIVSTSYLRKCNSTQGNIRVTEEYSNLLPNAVSALIPNNKKFTEKTFEAMMKPLVGRLRRGNEPTDMDLARVRHGVEKLFGSVDNFNTFIANHFNSSELIINAYLDRFKLHSIPSRRIVTAKHTDNK